MDINDLTNQELWHFAIHCSETGRHDHAIIYLKQLLKVEMNNIDALLLLSSEYAELKMFDNALSSLNSCKSLTSSPFPQFQLCLILALQNKQDEFDLELQQLMKLGKDNAFYHYATILSMLNQGSLENIENMFDDAKNCHNYNEFIENNLLSIYKNLDNKVSETKLNKAESPTNLEQSMFLSAYNGS